MRIKSKDFISDLGGEESIEPNFRQTTDKSCVLASTRMLEAFAFGFDTPASEGDLIEAATKEGIYDEKIGIPRIKAWSLLTKIGFTVTSRDNPKDILNDLKSGKGLMVFRDKHAVALYYDDHRDRLVLRDPEKPNPELHMADAVTLAEITKVTGAGGSKGTNVNPYGHLWVISMPAVEEHIKMEAAYSEKGVMSIEDRLDWIWKTYRPQMELPDRPKTIKLFGQETGMPLDEAPRHKFERRYNKLLEKAFQWELNKRKKELAGKSPEGAGRYLDRLEAQYAVEAIVVSEQVRSVTASDEEYKRYITTQVAQWESVKDSLRTDAQKREADKAIKKLNSIKDAMAGKGKFIGAPRVSQAYPEKKLAKKPSPWLALQELEIEYCRLVPVNELKGSIEWETETWNHRMNFLQQYAEISHLAEILTDEKYQPMIQSLDKHVRSYTKLGHRLEKMQKSLADPALGPGREEFDKLTREFINLRNKQPVEFHRILGEIASLRSKPEYESERMTGLELKDADGNYLMDAEGHHQLWVPDTNDPADLMRLSLIYETLHPEVQHRMREMIMRKGEGGPDQWRRHKPAEYKEPYAKLAASIQRIQHLVDEERNSKREPKLTVSIPEYVQRRLEEIAKSGGAPTPPATP
jgi:hypothetical protein